ELYMHKQLEAYEKDDAGIDPPATAKDQQADFAALIETIKQVTEIDSEPPATGDGRRPAANPELTALSSDIDPDGLAAASEKDAFRRDIAERLGKLFPKACPHRARHLYAHRLPARPGRHRARDADASRRGRPLCPSRRRARARRHDGG